MTRPLDVVREIFAAINRRDVDAALSFTSPQVVVDFSRSESPYRGTYEGQVELRQFWTDWLGSWEHLVWEAEDVEEVTPNRVVLVNHLTGRGVGSGVEVEARGGHVWDVEDGRVARMTLFQDGASAREAARADS